MIYIYIYIYICRVIGLGFKFKGVGLRIWRFEAYDLSTAGFDELVEGFGRVIQLVSCLILGAKLGFRALNPKGRVRDGSLYVAHRCYCYKRSHHP